MSLPGGGSVVSGYARATVEVSVDGDDLGTTTVLEDGAWSLPVTNPLAPGEHTVDAVQTDAGGNTLQAPRVSFTVVTDGATGRQSDGGSTTGRHSDAGSAAADRATATVLPSTGAPQGALGIGLLGLALLLAGGTALRRSIAC